MEAPAPITNGGNTRTIVLFLFAAIVLCFAGYRMFFYVPSPGKPLVRKTSDFIVTWRCMECGATRDDRAGAGPHVCEKCGKNASFASLRWSCSTHGVQTVAFNYDENGQPKQIKLPNEDWKSALDADGGWNLRCPTCKGPLMPAEPLRSADTEPD